MSNSALRWAKWGVYYLYIPVVIYIGYRTVKI